MGTNSSNPVNERDPSEGGLLFHDEFQSALNMVEWRAEGQWICFCKMSY